MQAGTYWLTRSSGGDELQLFDITEMAVEDAKAETADNETADKQAECKAQTEQDAAKACLQEEEQGVAEVRFRHYPVSSVPERETAEASAAAEAAAVKAAAAAAPKIGNRCRWRRRHMRAWPT